MNVIEPQKCRGKLREAMWSDPDYYAEFKFHGSRYLMYLNGAYNKFLSRHISVKGGYVDKSNSLPHLRDIETKLGGTILDGEIILNLFGTVRDVTSILGSSVELALQKQELRGFLKYMVFDIPYYKSRDLRGLSYLQRKTILSNVLSEIANCFIIEVPHYNSSKKAYYKSIVHRGGEGVVLKYSEGRYGERRHWIKVKKEQTYDVVILGYLKASPLSIKKNGMVSVTRYAQKGWIGSIEIGMYQPEVDRWLDVGSVSGMDETIRALLSANPDKYLGRVIEIKAQSQLESGKFEHGNFVRFRDDKRPEDCVYGE